MDEKRLISVVDSNALINYAKKQVGVKEKYIGVKYDATPNINPLTGEAYYYKNTITSMTYLASLAYTRVITIPNATRLKAVVTYQTENTANNDGLCIWKGNYPDYTYASNYSTSVTSRLYGALTTAEFEIEGDTLTIAFKSDSSSNYYGYWLRVYGYEEETEEGTIPWSNVMDVLTRPTTVMTVTPDLNQLSTGYISTIDLSNFSVDMDNVIIIGDLLTSTTGYTYTRAMIGKPIYVWKNVESAWETGNNGNLYWLTLASNPASTSNISIGPSQFYTTVDRKNKKLVITSWGGTSANKTKNPFSGNVTIIV